MPKDKNQASSEPIEQIPKDSPVRKLLDALKGKHKLLIVCHNYPDPDSIACAAAIKYLVDKLLGIGSRITFGGAITRPENRSMLRLLKINLAPISGIKLESYDAFACVDTQPGTGNNSLPESIIPDIVIDHHPPRAQARQAKFSDLRPKYGATASILTEYLEQSKLPIPPRLAAALFYGIASETQDLGRDATDADNRAYMNLFPKVNKQILAQIRNARLPREYLQLIQIGLHNSFTYKNVIGTRLGKVSGQEIIPFMADLLLKMERMTWAIVLGRVEDNLFISLRSNSQRARAGKALRKLVGKKGSAGGHDMMAGGYMSISGMTNEEVYQLENDLLKKFLEQRGHEDISDFDLLVSPGGTPVEGMEGKKAGIDQEKRENVTKGEL